MHFAGEHTSVHRASMNGALESGVRVAAERSGRRKGPDRMRRLSRRSFLKAAGAQAALARAVAPSRRAAEQRCRRGGRGRFRRMDGPVPARDGRAGHAHRRLRARELARQLRGRDPPDPRRLRRPRAVHAVGARRLRPLEGTRGGMGTAPPLRDRDGCSSRRNGTTASRPPRRRWTSTRCPTRGSRRRSCGDATRR